MNLSQLRTAVLARLGVDPSDGLSDPTTLNGFINDANHEIELEREWPWRQETETIITVAGQDNYAPGSFNTKVPLPTWVSTDELRRGDDARVLERYSVTELDDIWLPTQENGRPRAFAIWGDQLIIRPIPDAVYQLVHRYYSEEPDLVADTDAPSMPVSAHMAIAELATYIALGRDRNDPRASARLAAYERIVSKLPKVKRRYRTPGRIRTRPNGWT